MEASPGSRYATQRFGKTVKAVAGGVVLAACLLSLVLAGRSKGYQSQALLSYTAPSSSLAEGAVPAIVAADRALDDAHLLVILNTYDLYPQLRQRSPEQAVLAHMRSLMTVDEPDPASLRVSFLDQDERKSQSVTNDLAQILAAYRVAVPAGPAPASAPAAAKPIPDPVAAIPVPSRSGAPVYAETPAVEVRSRRRLAAVTAQLSALREEQAASSARAGAKTKAEPVREDVHPPSSEPRYTPPPAQSSDAHLADAHSADRAALEGRLAFEQSHLIALLARYTEEYPEVVATRGMITELESSLASLPAPKAAAHSLVAERPNPVVPPGRPSAIPGAEESAASSRFERNQRRVAALEREKEALTARLASASAGLVAPGSAPTPDRALVSQAAPVVAVAPTSAAGIVLPGTGNASLITDAPAVPPAQFGPFQIEQRALRSVPVRMYPPRTFAWIAAGTALLVLLILLPGLLRPAAPVSESEEYGRFLEVGMDSVQMYRPESSEETESAGDAIDDPDEQRSAYAPIAYQAAAFSSGNDSREPHSPEDFATQAVTHHELPAHGISSERAASEPSRPEATGAVNGDRNRAGNLDSRIARAVAKHYGS